MSDSTTTEDEYLELALKFLEMNGYKNTSELANECETRYQSLKEYREENERREQERVRQEQYDRLVQEKERASTAKDYQELAKKYRTMNGYKDSDELANECEAKYRKMSGWVFRTLRRIFGRMFD